MKRLNLLPIICISVLTLLSGCDTQPGSVSSDLIFTNAYVVDGMGEPGRVADVRVRGDRILEVGSLTPTDAETEIDATNLVLAPGFIDTHSHHDGGLEGVVRLQLLARVSRQSLRGRMVAHRCLSPTFLPGWKQQPSR